MIPSGIIGLLIGIIVSIPIHLLYTRLRSNKYPRIIALFKMCFMLGMVFAALILINRICHSNNEMNRDVMLGTMSIIWFCNALLTVRALRKEASK
jgi:multisubunit Na+/H+ antiporter MnhE subunit